MWFLGLGAVAGLLTLALSAWGAAEWAWWRPKRLGRALHGRGLRGTSYRLLHGDLKDMASSAKAALSRPMGLSHDIVHRVSPFLHNTIKKNGKVSFFWFGPYARVIISDPTLTREILSSKFGHFEKPQTSPYAKLLMKGLVTYDGEKWAKHRRLINPAFQLEKLKRMLPAFSFCCDELIDRWEKLLDSTGSCEVDVWPQLQNLTGDVISRAAFGSSYQEGRRIFELQTEQTQLLVEAVQNVYLPGFRFLPTKKNLRRKEIDRQVRALLTSIIKKRENAMRNGDANFDDLLGLLMESRLEDLQDQTSSKTSRLTHEDVIEECKLFYFAGQETTSVLLVWTMIILSMHPSWQARAREEILQIFGESQPDFDGSCRLKIVTMILYEVLRLYPPATFLLRKTYKEVKVGDITLPSGVQLMLPTLVMQHDPEIWGPDADEFKPERFSEGISKASNNRVAFFTFGWGPRICIGQNFAMLEAKTAIARILQHFSFELSPSYSHAPRAILTLQPQHGAQVILRRR